MMPLDKNETVHRRAQGILCQGVRSVHSLKFDRLPESIPGWSGIACMVRMVQARERMNPQRIPGSRDPTPQVEHERESAD